tara:strand:- start:610 stop:825 length:216 start_codon:yes stop_codon:yes gene_type:complete
MSTSKFEKTIARIVEEASKPQPTMTKVASLEQRIENLDGDVARSLTKVASLIRQQSIEPSYQDIIDFIGEG